MRGFSRYLLTLMTVFTLALGPVGPVFADQEDADEAVEDRLEKSRKEAAGERSERIKRDFLYKRTLEPTMTTIGPYNINVRVDGKAVYGFISFAIEADTIENRALIESYKPRVDEVVFPLAIEMYRSGRPGRDQFDVFRENALRDLGDVFGDRIQDIFVYQVL
ncbi:MAG: hypothetical protein NXI16_14065 [Alphaproteobacteria bacterium]|nr:hypothetical protein [Alphaproteobacteria bacterium]